MAEVSQKKAKGAKFGKDLMFSSASDFFVARTT